MKHQPAKARVWFSLLVSLGLIAALGAVWLLHLGKSHLAVTFVKASTPDRSFSTERGGIYLFLDHGLYPGGLKASKDDLGLIAGSHNMFSWRDLEPTPGKYNFANVDLWLSKLDSIGKKGVFGIMLRCGGSNGRDACTPSWALDGRYDPVVVQTGADCQIAENKRLNYINPKIKQRLKNLSVALANHYQDDPRVRLILIAPGFNGEPKPNASSTIYCYNDAEKEAYKAKGYDAKSWGDFTKDLVRFYAEAFRNKHVDLSVITTGTLISHGENIGRVNEAVKNGVGLHHSGWVADMPSGDGLGGVCSDRVDGEQAYRAMWPALEMHGEEVTASFEPHRGTDHRGLLGDKQALDQRSYVWWSVLNALDKHASLVFVYSNMINRLYDTWGENKPNPGWEWLYLDAWRFAKKYLGKTYRDTPAAWIAFRTSFNRYCGDNYDYTFYLNPTIKYDYPVVGHTNDNGHYAGELSHEASRYDKRPNRVGWIGPKDDWRGAYGREISARFPWIGLRLDSRIKSRLPTSPNFSVTYYDGKASDKGVRWRLVYNTRQGIKEQLFTLSGSDRWVTKTIKLTNFQADNKIDQGDLKFEIVDQQSPPIYFHFAQLDLVQASQPPSCDVAADFNQDGRVDLQDVSLLIKHIKSQTKAGDINCDGRIDLDDYGILLKRLRLF